MNRRGTGTTIVLVILVIICLIQGATLSGMEETLTQLNETVSDQNVSLRDLQIRVNELEKVIEDANDGLLSESNVKTSYAIKEIDWEAGKIMVDYKVNLEDVTEETSLVLENHDNVVRLEYIEGTFRGTMEYNIKDDTQSTLLYLYEGDRMMDDMELGTIGADVLLGKVFMSGYDGYTAYGNDRITLAGQIKYLCDVKQTITSVELICGEERKVIDASKRGVVDIVTSMDIGQLSDGIKDGTYTANMVYLEFKTDDGYTFQMYPYFYAYGGSSMNMDEEQMVPMDKSIYQDSLLKVTTPGGEKYEITLYYEEE